MPTRWNQISFLPVERMSASNTNIEIDPLDDSNRIIQGLWIGSELSIMEQMSIVSFLQNGHEYHLYSYNEIANVPAGVGARNANEILPASAIFQYKDRPSYAGFANSFRYKLLLERGGWWADSDLICLRSFDFRDEYVFSSEFNVGHQLVNCGAIKVPKGSEVMADAWTICQAKEPDKLVWGETGPQLMSEVVKKHGLEKYEKPYYIFCPISEWHKILQPDELLDDRAYAIHLWNEEWRRAGKNKNGRYNRNCIYERLKRTYLQEAGKAGLFQTGTKVFDMIRTWLRKRT